MNSRYNIGKVLYKVDSYVDRSQETIYTQNIISDNQIVKDELTIGEGSDDSIVKISQSTNPSTGELEGNIETPNIKITKELKFEGDNNTTIDNSGINADTIYVNNLYILPPASFSFGSSTTIIILFGPLVWILIIFCISSSVRISQIPSEAKIKN